MMGQADPQRTLFYQLSLETFVPAEHPLRAIRPLIDDHAIRHACRDLYAPIGRPSIPPEQLFLALVGGYLLGITSERKLVMELQCNMALRWFVGVNLDQDAWDVSTFSQNRRRRFDLASLLEQFFDDTPKLDCTLPKRAPVRGRQSQSAQVVKVESSQSQATDTGPRSTRQRSGPTLEWRERTRRRGPAQKH
jgi:transposase